MLEQRSAQIIELASGMDLSPEATPTLSSLKTRHREIARLMLLGKSNNEISELIGISPTRISQIKSDPMFRGYLASLEERCDRQVMDVRQRLANLSHEALDVVEELLKDDKSSIQLAAAKDILDRAGYKPVEKVETVNLSAVLSPEELQAIRHNIQRAKAEGYVVSEAACGSANR